MLDAIGQIQGLTANQSTRMWVAARVRTNATATRFSGRLGGRHAARRYKTNYQLMPGDRLFVSEDKLVAVDTRLGKIIAPFERIFGFTPWARRPFPA